MSEKPAIPNPHWLQTSPVYRLHLVFKSAKAKLAETPMVAE
ncbi:hypothetical protein GPB2148_2686 [marine gamma proteobacterium HTCC2148]|nr:hypothetical protein GPB2148_2686 [marine gamma proteobacterium HTCC2148]